VPLRLSFEFYLWIVPLSLGCQGDSYDRWLDPGMTDVKAVSELLKPYDARLMRCYPVSSRINHVANDDEECSAPVEVAQMQNQLFS